MCETKTEHAIATILPVQIPFEHATELLADAHRVIDAFADFSELVCALLEGLGHDSPTLAAAIDRCGDALTAHVRRLQEVLAHDPKESCH